MNEVIADAVCIDLHLCIVNSIILLYYSTLWILEKLKNAVRIRNFPCAYVRQSSLDFKRYLNVERSTNPNKNNEKKNYLSDVVC